MSDVDNVPESTASAKPFQHARDVGLIDWLADAVFMVSDLTDVCAHCLAQEVAKEVKRTLDAIHQDFEETTDGK
jgi:hypothetical protein